MKAGPIFISMLGAVCLAQIAASGQNLILNGDFENNGATVTRYNLSNAEWNSLVYNTTAFGTGEEIDLMTLDNLYGLPPESGLWEAAIHLRADGRNDAFSFNLSAPILAGQEYMLSFYGYDSVRFETGHGAVQLGLSSSPNTFGTVIFSDIPSTTVWTHFASTFTSSVDGRYLTVRVDPDAPLTWAYLDNFSLMPIPEPGALSLLCLAGLAGLVARDLKERAA